MRAKSVFLLMLALGCGLVASIGITQVMAKRNSAPAGNVTEMDAIFVAMEDIPMGEPVTAQMVELEEWPKDKIPEGALGKIENVENRRSKTKIYKGSPVLDNLLLSEGASELGAAGQIPKGYRVVPVRVDNVSGGGNMIRPMDRVDVLVHLTRNAAKEVAETTTRTILQDIKVFAVNDVYDLDTTDDSSKIIAQTISLLVPLEQAEKVILAEELGEIRLVMRSPDDTDEVVTGGARPSELFGPTESSNRDKEIVLASPAPLRTPPPSDDFLKFLNAHQTNPPAAPLPEPTECWTMRTIYGNEVGEVVLELGADQETPEGKKSSFPLWKKILSSVSTAGERAAAPPADVQPTEPEPEPPASDDGKQEELQEED